MKCALCKELVPKNIFEAHLSHCTATEVNCFEEKKSNPAEEEELIHKPSNPNSNPNPNQYLLAKQSKAEIQETLPNPEKNENDIRTSKTKENIPVKEDALMVENVGPEMLEIYINQTIVKEEQNAKPYTEYLILVRMNKKYQ